MIHAKPLNPELPDSLYLIAGDPSLELQAQVINQISGQSLPTDAWKNVHNWLKDLVTACALHLGIERTTVVIDCNPSFSAYTEVSMFAAEKLIVPCSSDGSSARAIDNMGALLYGVTSGKDYGAANFSARAKANSMSLPSIHSVLLNRSTQYSSKASKAFAAMFSEITRRTNALKDRTPTHFPAEGPFLKMCQTAIQ